MIAERIHAFIASGGTEGSFEELALELFAYQYEAAPLYRRLCDRRRLAPSGVRDWRDVPAAPVDLFKYGLTDIADRPYVFLSSGTGAAGEPRADAAAQERSRHALATLHTYRVSALAHFRSMVLADEPGPLSVLVLGPTAETHPHSSLGRMISWIGEDLAVEPPLAAFDADGRVAAGDAAEWLRAAAERTRPVLILGVSSAVTAVLDELRRRAWAPRLPADSRVVDTGGAKAYANPGAHARTYSPRALLKAVWRLLHVPAYLCVNEYGMTEMLSQFYDDALVRRVAGRVGPRAKVGPPWVRTSVVDPVRLEPVPPGERGLLRHFDLANWESVAALQTQDVGRALGDGFELLGRARGAEARGCSELVRAVVAADVDAQAASGARDP